jgi:hypothetical protein
MLSSLLVDPLNIEDFLLNTDRIFGQAIDVQPADTITC